MILDADEHVRRALRVVLGGPPAGRAYPSRIDRRALRTAFRRRAQQLHPDKALAVGLPARVLTQRFHELKRAYDFLESVIGANTAVLLDAARLWPSPAPAGIRQRGAIPLRRLRFAQYLYYAGVIDWGLLVAAMRWQHHARPRIGEIARQMSLLSSEDVRDILRRQLPDERFGEAALRLRHLDLLRLFAVLSRQRRFDRPIGRFFVEHGILTSRGLAEQLDRHWLHNLRCAGAGVRASCASAAAG